MIEKLAPAMLEAFLAEHRRVAGQSWELNGGKLCISLKFGTFAEAFAFMTSVALYAEKHDHHPEWTNIYNRIDIALTTHEAGGVTTRDLDLARFIARTYLRYGG